MIPHRKFSDYQRQVWETQTKVNAHSPQLSEAGVSFAPGRQHSPRGSYLAQGEYSSRPASRSGTLLNYPNAFQPSFSPFNQQYAGYHSPNSSVAGTETRVIRPSLPPVRQSQMSFGGFGSSSALGIPNASTALPTPMTARNSSYSLAEWAGPGHGNSFSVPSVSPFADQYSNLAPIADPTNPTDADLVSALQIYLRTQDLLQVTKVRGFVLHTCTLCS